MYKLIIGLLFFYFTVPCFGSMDLLTQPFGVRAVGMGGAYTALAEGPDSIFYNYAAKPFSGYPFFKTEYGTILETSYLSLCAENIFNIPFIKYGYLYAFDSDIPYTELDSSNHPILSGSSFSYSSHVGIIALQSEFFGFQLGLSGTGYLESLEKSQAKAFCMGGSILKEWEIGESQLITAITVKNLLRTKLYWSGDYQETIPYYIIGGISYQTLQQQMNINLDLVIKNSGYADAHFELYQYYCGIEYWLLRSVNQTETFCVRSGLLNGSFTLGLGFMVQGLSFDFAYLFPKETYLDNTMRFSIGYHFFPFPAVPEKKKTYIPMVDSQSVFPLISQTDTINKSLSDKEKEPLSQTASFLETLFSQKKSTIPTFNIQPTENIDQLEENAIQKARQAYPERKIMIATLNIPQTETLDSLQTQALKTYESDIIKQDEALSAYFPSQNEQNRIIDQTIDIDSLNKQLTIHLSSSELVTQIRFGDTILSGEKTYHYTGSQNLALQSFSMSYFFPFGMMTVSLKQVQQKLYLDGYIPTNCVLYIDRILQEVKADHSFHYELKNNLYMNPSVHLLLQKI